MDAATEERIVELRKALGERYQRVVGARTISLTLRQDPTREWKGVSPTSVWRVLRERQCIVRATPLPKAPFVRPQPGAVWELDFCTLSPKSEEAPEKNANALEAFSVVDRGSSAQIASEASTAYDAHHTLETMAAIVQREGLPRCVVVDQDPRFVGSASTDAYPSAFIRFLTCLGVEVDVLPPHRPDLKPFVERHQRTVKTECFGNRPPADTQDANERLGQYRPWYNLERPHQGRDLAGSPPGLVLRQGPSRSRLPERVDPDAWLSAYHNQTFRRQIDQRGTVRLWKQAYSLGKDFAQCQDRN